MKSWPLHLVQVPVVPQVLLHLFFLVVFEQMKKMIMTMMTTVEEEEVVVRMLRFFPCPRPM